MAIRVIGDRMQELISVIVPVYNVENYLKECVESIQNQTYKNLEIILVDDGSTDSSGKICDNFQTMDERVKVFHKMNGGVSSARNCGLHAAKGKWVGFIDADDVIHTEMYEKLYNSIIKYNAELAFCLMERMYGKQKDNDESGEPVVLEGIDAYSLKAHFGLTPRPHIGKSVCDKLFSRELLEGIRFDEKYSLGEDNLFITRVLLKQPRCIYLGQNMYFYRDVREGNSKSLGVISQKTFSEQIPLKKLQIKLLQDSGYWEIAENELVVFYKELLRYHKLIGNISDEEQKKEFYIRLRKIVLEEKQQIKKTFYLENVNWKYVFKYQLWLMSDGLLKIIE